MTKPVCCSSAAVNAASTAAAAGTEGLRIHQSHDSRRVKAITHTYRQPVFRQCCSIASLAACGCALFGGSTGGTSFPVVASARRASRAVTTSSSRAFSGGLVTVRLSTVHWIVRKGQHSPLSIPRLSVEDVLQYVVGVKVQTSLVMNSPDAVPVQQCWIRAPLHGWFKARTKPEGSRKAQ